MTRWLPAALLTLSALTVAAQQQADEERERVKQLQSLPYIAMVDSQGGATGVVGARRGENAPGVNFYANRYTNTAYLMDNAGRTLHKWEMKDRSSWYDATVTPAGELLVIGGWDVSRGGEFPGEKGFPATITKLSADSRVLWRKPLPGHHEVRVLKNGMILALIERTKADPKTRTEKKRRPGRFVDNAVALLTPDGTLVREVSVFDLVRATPALQIMSIDAKVAAANGAADRFHCNAAQWLEPDFIAAIGARARSSSAARALYVPGNVVLTSRHQNFVAVFSFAKKKIVWSWGQQKDGLDGPHAGSMLPNGNILVFDNGLLRGWSRIVEIDPLTNQVVWEFSARDQQTFYNPTGGYVQRLENANLLVTDSARYQVLEVTPERRVVWKWINPDRTFTYRMSRLPFDYFTMPFRAQLQRSAGERLPIETSQ